MKSVPSLSTKERLILELLTAQDRMYGLQLVAASRGRIKRGTVYVTLGRMEQKGYVRSRVETQAQAEGRLPRRLYEPTPHGLRVLQAWTAVVRALEPEHAR